jgi:hypothetical protein
MKKVILGAALCGAAVALAGAANADGANDLLSGSSNSLIMGVTGIPTPDAAYISDAENLFLDPNGYHGSAVSALALTTPETYNFDPSVTQGESDIVNAVVADYGAGDMDCTTTGLCSEPLTVFAYSQSAADLSLAEQQLADDGIPTEALRFVMLGADPLGVPDNLYPTDVYNIDGDFWAEPGTLGTSLSDIVYGMLLHDAYLGLTPAEIDSATPLVEGLTTIFNIPTLTGGELWDALIGTAAAG